MKKNTTIIVIVALVLVAGIAAVLLLGGKNNPSSGESGVSQSGTSDPQAGNEKPTEDLGYVFEYKGVQLSVDAPSEKILEALGEPINYFEAPSCAFVGLDKIYTYSGFEFQTYTENDKDYIASFRFLDDTVTTPEGIGLNSSLEDVIAAYGENYRQSFTQYTYTKGGCNLSFILEDNEVVSVEYVSVKFAEANE